MFQQTELAIVSSLTNFFITFELSVKSPWMATIWLKGVKDLGGLSLLGV